MLKKTLGELNQIEIVGGLITSRIEDKTGSSGKAIKVLVPKAISFGTVDKNNLGTLCIKDDPDDKKITHEGDIVIKLSTPFDACIITKENEGLLVPSFCVILRVNDVNINKEYLVAYLNSAACYSQIKDMVLGSSIAILSTATLKKVLILLPDENTQDLIANRFMITLKKQELLSQIIILENERLNSQIFQMMEE